MKAGNFSCQTIPTRNWGHHCAILYGIKLGHEDEFETCNFQARNSPNVFLFSALEFLLPGVIDVQYL